MGWIRTTRSADKGAILFVELTDGSTPKGVQLVLSMETTSGAAAVASCGGVGASLSVTGTVVQSSGKGQTIEIQGARADVLGAVYGGENGEVGGKHYPMAKKQHTLEFLREQAHLRPRSKVFSAALRVRHAMAFAVHNFYNQRGFVYVHTPLITAADCEGAGEQFLVTTLLPKEDTKVSETPTTKEGLADYSKDFFGRRCSLTVSGQLNVETHACALSDVYTFGPTFRAENSHTSRHLAAFWMIEPEICFADIWDDMSLAEDFIKYCTQYALDNCADDLEYFEEQYPKGERGLRARLRNVVDNDFARISYTEAVALLQEHIASGQVVFENPVEWGGDLNSEHERYLSERLDVLERRCGEAGLHIRDLWWYADLRRYGSVPHSGFGLGFERLLMFVTGLESIKDVISFPRVPGQAEF
ncbi:asnS [Symbiodinium microadriaticum]|nr:asnS [Symbiodinium microadriaticum]